MTKRKREPRRTRRTFTPEFRREAVRLLVERREAGASVEAIARDLDLSPDLLRKWGKDLGVIVPVRAVPAARGPAPPGAEAAGAEAAELRRLRRELEVARQERDFLKKAVAFFAKESR